MPRINDSTIRFSIFPTLVYAVECFDLIDDVKNACDSVDWSETYRSSHSDSYSSKIPIFGIDNNIDLVQKIEQSGNYTLIELGYTNQLQMTTNWFTKTSPYKGIGRHNHTNSFWSSVYYFDDDCGYLSFTKDMNAITVPTTNDNPELKMFGDISFPAKKGTLLLFPSYLPHYVEINNFDKERFSLAMNFMPVGRCGVADSTYDYK